ncbi:hypothetical protein J2T20_001130 [Paenibacillus wynnii]|nr:hypothetical protein [Paenibacillus wynnii]
MGNRMKNLDRSSGIYRRAISDKLNNQYLEILAYFVRRLWQKHRLPMSTNPRGYRRVVVDMGTSHLLVD